MASAARLAFEDRPGLPRQRHFMQSPVLRSRRRQYDQPALKINFAPSKSPDLFAALAGEDQQPDDIPELIGFKGSPHFGKLRIR